MHENDLDLSLDGLGLDAEAIPGASIGVDNPWDVALSMDGDDLTVDAVADGGLNIDLDLDLDLDLEGEGLDAATLLRTQIDISKEFLRYHSWTIQALQKMEALMAKRPLEFPMPAITEFSFIPAKQERQMVYGFFCAMMKDLVTMPKYASLGEEGAYDVMLLELFQELHYTPNIHRETLRRIFNTYYENNKKLARVHASEKVDSVADLIDIERVRKAELVYGVNSYAFDIATRFFSDPALANPKATIRPSEFGEFSQEIKKSVGAGSVKHKDVFDYIASFLQSEDVLKMLQITRDESLNFTIGELLRRYVVTELNDGSFYPAGMKNFKYGPYSEEAASQVITTLMSAMQKESFTAEILYLILTMMFAMPKDEQDEYFRPFTMQLGRYLSAFVNDKANVNPVFYTYIGKAERTDDAQVFELGYAEGEKSYTVNCPDVLFEVVGDNTNIYHVPLVYLDGNMHSVLCPPPEVVNGVRKLSPSGRISVNGNITYRFTPSFSWLSTLSLASAMSSSEEHYDTTTLGQDNNPLLDMLLHYTNKFDTSGEQPNLVSVSSNMGCSFVGLQMGERKNIRLLSLDVDSRKVNFESGQVLIDDDHSVLLRYKEQNAVQEEVLLLKDGEYQAQILDREDTISGGDNSAIELLFSEGMSVSIDAGDSYSRTVTKRVCDLNALDYDAMLEEARCIIARDLLNILNVTVIDQVLGARMIEKFLDLIKSNGGRLDSFNLGTLKELLDFTYGDPNILTGVKEFTPELMAQLEKLSEELYNDGNVSIQAWLKHFDELDIHSFALQSCSRSELQEANDSSIYWVLHSIPACHARLRLLEDQLVLMKALYEIDSDIVAVLRKNSAIFTAYNTVCTADSVQRVEATLKSGMRVSNVPPCLNVTRAILFNTFPENCAIVKYFVLERNAYGVLTELEECLSLGSETYKALYEEFKERLGVPDIDEVRQLTEAQFRERVSQKKASKVFYQFHDRFTQLCLDGLIAEASGVLNIETAKAYDILTAYGRYLFNLPETATEDLADVADFVLRGTSYVGSFIITYCPVIGEAADEIDGGFDRYSAFLRHKHNFQSLIGFEHFENCELRDLKLVSSADNSDILNEETEMQS